MMIWYQTKNVICERLARIYFYKNLLKYAHFLLIRVYIDMFDIYVWFECVRLLLNEWMNECNAAAAADKSKIKF